EDVRSAAGERARVSGAHRSADQRADRDDLDRARSRRDDIAASSISRSARNRMSLHVSWNEYNTLVERLALRVHQSGFTFNQVICIARGGLRVGDVLSRIFEQPLAILSTHSYAADSGTIRGELVIAEHMTMTKPRLGNHVLLVDDMVDSGHTLDVVFRELPKRFPHIAEIKTAVLWWKGCSTFRPDYAVEYLPDNPWIHQPFEIYDTLRPEALAERLAVRAVDA